MSICKIIVTVHVGPQEKRREKRSRDERQADREVELASGFNYYSVSSR